VIRRRYLHTVGRRVVSLDDDVLDLDAVDETDLTGEAALLRRCAAAGPGGWTTSSPPSRRTRTASFARTCVEFSSSKAGRAPERPLSRCTGPPTSSIHTEGNWHGAEFW
jgi:hypothetical protein